MICNKTPKLGWHPMSNRRTKMKVAKFFRNKDLQEITGDFYIICDACINLINKVTNMLCN